MKKSLSIVGILVVLVLGVIFISSNNNEPKIPITMYKSPNCGCCVGHATYLESNGFDVEIIPTNDMGSIKDKYNVPQGMGSCHTLLVGDYFVEGHMPVEMINQLLEEQPEIDGIALPNMPAGSPGMPGTKSYAWTIYSVSNGQSSEFATL